MNYTNSILKKRIESLSRGDRTYAWTAKTVGSAKVMVIDAYSKGKRIEGTNRHVLKNSIESLLDEESEPDPRLLLMAA
jgi:hypothetical protein